MGVDMPKLDTSLKAFRNILHSETQPFSALTL